MPLLTRYYYIARELDGSLFRSSQLPSRTKTKRGRTQTPPPRLTMAGTAVKHLGEAPWTEAQGIFGLAETSEARDHGVVARRWTAR